MSCRSEVRSVSPTLADYTITKIERGLWLRPGLSRKDRSIVTLAALLANGQRISMAHYFNNALDEAMKPAELSELVTHLAFYAGWPNAFAAVDVLKDNYIGLDAVTLGRALRARKARRAA
ncbi:carboxymuconolactone decarboxylase family protein [Bradyrhizobium sp. WSM2254]|uniref:carboxymuconolactone decarboxylase family protein n=1 Tax=Bradyrhizobium sp. WSM2254 TaxID=1188263 RepID=UPI0004116072|nr:carboxymuconolactone decarboxylase family protein [Bradyrhizobium sp. WSM2254]